MAVRFIDSFGTVNQIEAVQKIAISFNLQFKVLNARVVISGRLYSIEVKVEGDLIEINEFINKIQNTY